VLELEYSSDAPYTLDVLFTFDRLVDRPPLSSLVASFETGKRTTAVAGAPAAVPGSSEAGAAPAVLLASDAADGAPTSTPEQQLGAGPSGLSLSAAGKGLFC
jgi:hypothetical protein